MDKDFLKKQLEEKVSDVKDTTKPELPQVDYRERYGTLRNQINDTRATFKSQIAEIKDLIEKRNEEMGLLKIKLNKLEGAVEASDLYLKASLPSNAKS